MWTVPPVTVTVAPSRPWTDRETVMSPPLTVSDSSLCMPSFPASMAIAVTHFFRRWSASRVT